MSKKLLLNSVKQQIKSLTRLSKKLNSVKVKVALGTVVIFAIVGTVGALNGWFGGGAKVPEDTMTRGLVGYWSMDEAAGPLVFDKSGNGNDGMINDGGSGNPVAYWTFDEGSGSTAYDYTGSNNGTLTNGPAWTSSGRIGGALEFDGKDDYVSFPTSLVVGTKPLTLQVWVYHNNAQNDGKPHLISEGRVAVGNYTFSFGKYTNNQFYAGYYKDVVESRVVLPAGTFNEITNNWVMFTIVIPETGVSSLYFNGTLKGVGTIEPTAFSATNFTLGNGTGWGPSWFDGKIDDVRIYNYARSATQIQRDYQETYKAKFVDGKVGGAMEFDGKDDYVEVPDSASLDITNALTLEAWIKTPLHDPSDERGMIIVKRNAYRFSWNETSPDDPNFGSIYGSLVGCTGANEGWLSGALLLDTWYYVAMVYDGSTYKGYVNGEYTGRSITCQGPISASAYPIYIGGYPTYNSAWHKGMLDEVRIYNRALSKEEMRYHYNRGGPVAHWKFDEGNGTTTYDSTDNDNDGQFMTAASSPTWVTGKYGTALAFDGTDDYVTLGDALDNTFTGANKKFTLEAWFKQNETLSGGKQIISKLGDSVSGGDQRQFALSVVNGKINFNYFGSLTGASYRIFQTDTTAIVPGQWYHVVTIYDGNLAYNSRVAITINGIVQSLSITASSGSPDAILDGTAPLAIGAARNTATAYVFNGLIDDVQIYNYARTADEIRLDYNAGFGVRFGPSAGSGPAADMTRGLVGYWNMDEGSGDFVYDQSDYQNTGYVRPEGKALSFDGVDDKITAPNLSLASFTIDVWLKLADLTADRGIIGQITYATSWYGWGIIVRKANDATNPRKIDFLTGNNVSATELYSVEPLYEEQYYHVVATYHDGAMKLYINGSLDNSRSGVFASHPTENVQIGITVNDRKMNGLIDEVRIYNRALSATEIAEHYKGIFSDETGLVGYWPLDEGYGNTANDESGKGNHGTLVNGPVWKNNAPRWTEGAPSTGSGQAGGTQGTALSFDGVDDYVNVGNGASLDITSAITIEVWVKITSFNAWARLISKSNGPDPTYKGYEFFLNGGTPWKIVFALGNGGNGWDPVSWDVVTPEVSLNEWHHVVGTYDGTTQKVFFDGVAGGTFAQANALASVINNLLIGDRSTLGTPINGLIDEVRIYNRALSAEEVRYHYNRGGPVAHWKFDEGSGTTTYDSSWNNNDGQFLTSETSPVWTTGKYGTALSFDGENDYADITDDTTLRFGTDDFTLEAWINTVSSSDVQMILSNYNNADQVFGMWVHTEGKFKAVYRDAPILETNVASNNAVNDGNWHHVVAQRSGNFIYVYVDGIRQTNIGTGVDDANFDPNGGWEIGHQPGSANRYFNGLIDDVRIYNYARTAEEIRLDYNQGLAGRFAPTDAGCDKDPAGCMSKGLVGYWGMDEGSGDFAYDQSDYQNLGHVGPDGKSLSFDGTDDYVTVGSGASLQFSSVFTVEWWGHITEGNANASIIAKDTNDTNNWKIKRGGNTRIDFDYGYTNYLGWTNVSSMSANWSHFVLTINGTTAILYQNGVSLGTKTLGFNVGDNNNALYIGRGLDRGSMTWKYIQGLIDEVRIYNRALSATEIAEHYKGIFSNETGLVLYVPLDDGKGDIAYDRSQYKNNGTLTSFNFNSTSGWKNNAPRWAEGAPSTGSGQAGGTQGTALSFDGVDDYVETTVAQSTTTVSMWVQNSGTWEHVVNVDGTEYVNGVTGSPTSYPIYFSGTTVQIGKTGASAYFSGKIDEVRIYNRALSAEEIRYHYNRGGPVAEWKFDEGSGTTTYDETNNNNDGTFVTADTSPVWVAGKYGSALQFDGVNDYVQAPHSASLSYIFPVTVEAWVKPDRTQTDADGHIIRKMKNYDLRVLNTGQLRIFYYDGGTNRYSTTITTIPNLTWSHVAVTFQASGSNTLVSFYINGQLDKSETVTGQPVVDTDVLRIGAYASNAERYKGLIDEVRIYNYARTAEQILQDYNGGVATYFK